MAIGPVILVRRIKDLHDRTKWIDESYETLNSANEFDVKCLEMAKPGEFYRVLWMGYGPILEQTIFPQEEVAKLIRVSGCVEVIEQEDWNNYLQGGRDELAREQPWWEPKIARFFSNYADSIGITDYSQVFHVSFANPSPHTSCDVEQVSSSVTDGYQCQPGTASSAIAFSVNTTLEPRKRHILG